MKIIYVCGEIVLEDKKEKIKIEFTLVIAGIKLFKEDRFHEQAF